MNEGKRVINEELCDEFNNRKLFWKEVENGKEKNSTVGINVKDESGNVMVSG